MANAAARLAGQVSSAATERVKVPLLAELLAGGSVGDRRVWADLGSAQSGLIETLDDGLNCILVADLPRAFEDPDVQWYLPDNVLDERFWIAPVDCFLCWDLLNYMRPEQLVEFSARIAHRAGADASVHALIQYSGKSMSQTPGRYRLEADGQLSVVPNGAALASTPRYSPKALEKSMPELRVERTMLLNNGMQEFIFSVR